MSKHADSPAHRAAARGDWFPLSVTVRVVGSDRRHYATARRGGDVRLFCTGRIVPLGQWTVDHDAPLCKLARCRQADEDRAARASRRGLAS